jgi:endonuclease YncB( thermonuclease family)
MIPRMIRRSARLLALAAPVAVACLAVPARAEEIFSGPVSAAVVRALDGDTLEVQAHVWLGLELTQHVRIRGIDAPELHSTCASERQMAETARDRLATLAGDSIRLKQISNDKYGGRVDADVVNAAGTDVGQAMIAAGLVHAYAGGARGDWCPVGSITPAT